MRLVLLGAPGSGKGTQAILLEAKYGFVHISTGDILRKNFDDKTELGLRTDTFMNRGELVPDAIIVDMVKERLGKDDTVKGFIMDGFPRTIPQADVFDKMLDEIKRPVDAAILIKIDDELVLKRLTNRRTCRACGKVLSLLVDVAPGTKNCPDCGGELYQRDDDTDPVILNRIEVYREHSEPLAGWYEAKGLLRSFEVNESTYPEETLERIEAALGL